jgi:hypothetical protein
VRASVQPCWRTRDVHSSCSVNDGIGDAVIVDQRKAQSASVMHGTVGRRLANLGWAMSILILLCPGPALPYVSDDEWRLLSKKDKELLVYTKVVEGQPIKAVKAVKNLDVSIETLLTVLADAGLVPEWVPVIGEAELLQETDPDGVSIMYMVARFPWPVRDRDTVVKTAIEYDKESNTVIMESTGISGYVEQKRGIIRIPATYTRWKIVRLDSGELHVELITHSDPGGHFPKWLMNMIMKRTPKKMFAKLQQVLDEEREKNRPFDEIFVFGKRVGL